MVKRLKWGGAASLAAGVLWITLWAGYLATHGATMFDRQRTLFALTWYDISKFVVFALLGFVVGLASLRTVQAARSGRIGNIGYILTLIGFALLITGALGFWLVPWGSYYSAGIRESVLYKYSGIVMFLSPTLIGVGMIMLGVDMLRAKVFSRGNWMPLLIGIAAFSPYLLWTNIGFIFGLSWGILGFIMIIEATTAPEQIAL